MPDKIVTGTPGMIPQGVVRTHSPRTGYTNTLRWIGEKKYGPGIEQQLIAAGYETSFIEDGPNCIVEGTRAGVENPGQVEVPVDRWERRINRLEKSIYENQTLITEMGSTANVQILKQQVEDKDFQLTYTNAPQAGAWYDLILRGVDSFVVFQPVVTLTRTVSDRYDKAQIAKTNVGKILTYAQMQSLEGAPAFVLDERPAYSPPSGVNFSVLAGYFKNDPQFVSVAENKWEVTIEWELGYWSTKIYSAATG